MREQKDSPVNINVGGTMYTVSPSSITNYPGTMLGSMLSNRWNAGENNHEDPIFLDRDPVLFRYILSFYRNGKIVIPCTVTKAEMFAEVEYFALPLEKESIQYDLESIAEIKQGFHDFDDMVVAKLKKTAHEGAVVACAHELAALMIEKFHKTQPVAGTEIMVGLRFKEVPATSFAKVMCPDVLNEKVFQDTIQGIVEQAGYTFMGTISSENFKLARLEPSIST